MSDNKRNLKNFIINPEFQTRLILYFFAISMAITGVMVFFINRYMSEVWVIVANIQNIPMDDLTRINAALNGILRVSIVFLILGLLVTVGLALVISHRIAGPMFAIIKFIDQLIEGDYTQKRNLRPYDELIPIMERLHVLADKLKK